MFYYVPEYNEVTAIKRGELASAEDVMARSRMIRECGGNCSGEVWKQHKGYVPRYEFPRELTKVEMEMLCLCAE